MEWWYNISRCKLTIFVNKKWSQQPFSCQQIILIEGIPVKRRVGSLFKSRFINHPVKYLNWPLCFVWRFNNSSRTWIFHFYHSSAFKIKYIATDSSWHASNCWRCRRMRHSLLYGLFHVGLNGAGCITVRSDFFLLKKYLLLQVFALQTKLSACW